MPIPRASHRSAALPGGPVLVVGGGNSGFQIAEELAATRQVDLSIGERSPMLPQRLAGRDLFWWLTRLGVLRVTIDTRLGRRASRREFIIGTNKRPAPQGRGYGSGADWLRLMYEQSDSLTAARYTASACWSGRPATVPTTPGSISQRRLSTGGWSPPRRDQDPGPVLPGLVLAAYPGLGPARLGQRRCPIPHRPDRRPPAEAGVAEQPSS
jgi:hypothetical protein